MATLPPSQDPSLDGKYARNATKVIMHITPAGGGTQRIGRIQSMREDISNNVQVLDELGRAFAVELKKGITHYTFTISRFYCRNDVFDDLKLGAVFGLSLLDVSGRSADGTGGSVVSLERFQSCMITSLSRDYTIGQAVVGENATVVTIGQGLTQPV